MARVFDMTAATDAVRLDTKGQGDAAFTVSNVSGRRTRGRAKAVPKDPATAGWLKIAGDVERDFPSSGSQLFTVNVAVPSDARPGTYSFRLDMVSVDNPDEETAQGPAVGFTVADAAPPPPKSHLMWFILAVVVLLIVGGGAIWFVLRKPAPATFAGSWSTNFARLELKQDGAKVTGEYRLYGSDNSVAVVGTVEGRMLSGVLGDPATNTTFNLALDPATRSFSGTWGANKPWCGVSAGQSSLPEGCSFTGQWTLIFEKMPLAAALTQVANNVTGTIDMGAPDHRKVSVSGELKGWALEGELKDLLGAGKPPRSVRWTAVDQKFQQFYGIQYDLSRSDAAAPEPGVIFADTCGFRQGASAPVPCRDPMGIVFSAFSLEGGTITTPIFEDNGALRAIKVEGDFRATIVARGVTARPGQFIGIGTRPPERPAVWIRVGKGVFDDLALATTPYVIRNVHGEGGTVEGGTRYWSSDTAANTSVHFMIERRGDAIRSAYSLDGKSWPQSPRADDIAGLNFAPGSTLEVYATAVGVKAEFLDFAVNRP